MAKKFNFRFESILKIRAEKVTQAQESLNQAVKVRLDKEQAIQEFIDSKNNLEISKPITTKAQDLQNKIFHKQHIESEINRLEKEKQQIVEIENLRRNKLGVAMKEEKVMEKLKDKKLSEHIDEVKREEGIFFDEIGLNISQKNSKNQDG